MFGSNLGFLLLGSCNHAASGGAAIGSEILCRSSRKLGLDVAALTISKGAGHVAALDAFAPCARRLQRGARRGFGTRSLRATSAERCPRGLRAHSGLCHSEGRTVVASIALSFLVADTSRRRTNTHHPHKYGTCFIRCAHRTHAHQVLTKVGHIRHSVVPTAHRRARLGAHNARPADAGGLRPPQRAHELRDGGAVSTLLCVIEPRERLGRSPLRLLLAAECAAQQAQPVRVEDASCAQGDQRRRPHRSRVHSVGGEDGG